MTALKVCSREGCFNVFEADHGRKYCSGACKHLAYYYRQRGPQVACSTAVKRNCRNCGRVFWTTNRYRTYCMDACKQQHYRERKKLEE